jgi:glycine rich protein/type IX secretion system substrate protein
MREILPCRNLTFEWHHSLLPKKFSPVSLHKIPHPMKTKLISLFLSVTALCFWAGSTYGQTSFIIPGVYTYTVPVGVTYLTVDMAGAQGGYSTSSFGSGGLGGRMQCVLNVTPGQMLNVYVGGQGGSAPRGGAGGPGLNGGGNGGASAGGGGGSSDIRMSGTALSNRVVVAGAGGGGAAILGDPGGDGGGASGADGIYSGYPDASHAGAGGSATTGGAGAILATGSGGGLGYGGIGSLYGGGGYFGGSGGGGGGAGYYGGGGGYDGSGGGGSSWPTSPTTICAGVTTTSGYNTRDGYVNLGPLTCPFISGDVSPFCPGNSTILSGVPAGGTWTSGSSSIATVASTGTVTGVSGGTAVISYTVAGLGCVGTQTVSINPMPYVAPLIVYDSSLALDTSLTLCVGEKILFGDSVFGGTLSVTNGNASVDSRWVTGITPGTVTVKYTYTNSCGSTFVQKAFQVVDCAHEGVGSVNTAPTLRLYPNPAADDLIINCTPATWHTFSIRNLFGQLILSGPVPGTQTHISIKALPPGTYYLYMRGDDGQAVRRFEKM